MERSSSMNEIDQLLINKKQDILDTVSRYHATNVRLFGSVARNEAGDESDIDLLVDFLPGASLLDQIGLIQELSERLNRKVDVVSSRALNKHLRQRILNEARPL